MTPPQPTALKQSYMMLFQFSPDRNWKMVVRDHSRSSKLFLRVLLCESFLTERESEGRVRRFYGRGGDRARRGGDRARRGGDRAKRGRRKTLLRCARWKQASQVWGPRAKGFTGGGLPPTAPSLARFRCGRTPLHCARWKQARSARTKKMPVCGATQTSRDPLPCFLPPLRSYLGMFSMTAWSL
jgi:hypothetical protein